MVTLLKFGQMKKQTSEGYQRFLAHKRYVDCEIQKKSAPFLAHNRKSPLLGLLDFPLHSGKSLGPPYTVSIALRGFVARPPIALGEERVAAQPPTALGEEPGELYLVQERDVQKR